MPERGFAIPAERLAEPVLLLTADGRLLKANRAAVDDLGLAEPAGGRLADLCAGDGDRLAAYLGLCATSREPLPGAVTLKDGREYRADGFLLHPADGERGAVVCLRLHPKAGSVGTFVALNDKITELSREVRVRLAAEALLTQALADKTVLIQELHHRIRNTLQILASLASLEARRTDGAARTRLSRHAGRANAIGLIYRHLYAPDLLHVPIAGFLGELCADLGSPPGEAGILAEEEADGVCLTLETAVPFALLLHDLIVARLDGPGPAPLRVRIACPAPGTLEFRMTGGMPATAPADADLRLSERLARQIGAELHSDGDGVRLTLPCPATAFVETDG